MKIIILSDYFADYQENRASFRIREKTAIKLAKKGHIVTFIYPNTNCTFSKSKHPHLHLESIGTPGILPMKYRNGGFGFLDMLIKSVIVFFQQADIIQVTNGHRPSQLIPCLIAKFILDTKIVNECWEWLGSGGYADNRKGVVGKMVALYDNLLELPIANMFDTTIAISTTLKKRYRKKSKVTVLHGGIETSSLSRYAITTARQRIGLSTQNIIIGMSNVSHGDHKDNCIFFESLKLILKQYPNLQLICTSTEKKYINLIRSKYALGNNLIYPGYVDFKTYNLYLSSCNFFVLPFPDTNINRGRWPNKIGDYIYLQRPIITNPNGDLQQLFANHNLGLLCKYTPQAFYESSIKLIQTLNSRQEQQSEAFDTVSEQLSFDKRIENFLKIFNKIII